MKILFGFIVALFLIVSCQQNESENIKIDKMITFDYECDAAISKDIDSVIYSPLELDSLSLYSNNSKVVFRGGKIFIGDFFLHKIVVYNDFGQFLYTINSKGRATNEYLEIKSFCVTDDEIAIIDNANHLLKIYDVETGRFIENKRMPFVAWDVEWLEGGGYIFAFSSLQKSYNPNELKYRLFFTDENLNITKKLFPYGEDEIDPLGKMTYFSLSQESIVFHWYGADYFSIINRVEHDSIKIVAVDFGNKKIPSKYRENMDEIDRGGYYYLGETAVTNGNYIAFDITNPNSSDCYLYSVSDDAMTKNCENESMGMLFPSCVDEKGRFICFLHSSDEYNMLVQNGFPPASKEVEDHIKKGGVTILRYATK